MQVKDKVIIVTGGGSGIGRALTLLLVSKGARVAAVDINAETLKETVELAGEKGEQISTHVVNVADRTGVEGLPEAVLAAHGAVDGLVNNAGIIQPFVKLNDLEFDAIERVMNVNLWGPIYLLKTFLPLLMERPEAHIVNVSSMGGFFPVPGQVMYGATKAAIKLLTEGLRSELSETNVGVTVIFPGAIETNITQNSGVVSGVEGEDSGDDFPSTPAPIAAEQIVEGIEKNKYSVHIGSDSKMMDKLYRLSPKRASAFMYNQMKSLLNG